MADDDILNLTDVVNGINDVRILDNESEISNEPRARNANESTDMIDLPNILIVTQVDEAVFDSRDVRDQFESLFLEVDSTARFHYLKSFRRARVIMETAMAAARARIRLHETVICGKRVKCYFAQPLALPDSSPHLLPPKPDKQFLISPPASPPVGWEPVNEANPIVNYDLLRVIANLAPGETHELHSGSNNQPSIVVHVCDDPEGYSTRPPMVQTARPDKPS